MGAHRMGSGTSALQLLRFWAADGQMSQAAHQCVMQLLCAWPKLG